LEDEKVYESKEEEEWELDQLMINGSDGEKYDDERWEVDVSEVTIREMLLTVRDFFPAQGSLGGDRIRRVLKEAKDAVSNTPGVKEANVWANGFDIDPATVERDVKELAANNNNLALLAENRLRDNNNRRLSRESVARLSVDNPEKDRLLELAGGMPVYLPSPFVCNGASEKRAPLSKSYLSTSSAMNKMLMETHQEGHALVLPLGVAQNIEGLHLAVARWVPKNAKDQGRSITDMTYVEGQALNSKFSKEAADKKWGVIKHPTIFRVCNMINRTLEKLQEKNPLATSSPFDRIVFRSSLWN
jgi:hypothetical protein